MLALPLQRGENVDMAASFYAFLQSQFGEDGIGSTSSDVVGFQQLRDSAICVLDPTEIGTQCILRYNYHLNFMAPRLKGYESELRLNFNWYDGFRSSRKVSTTSIVVDWACLLWNLGAIESQRGAKIDRSSEEGIRNASKHFQQAAGIFEHIRKNLSPQFQGTIVSGLTEEGLHLAVQLMLAQSQLCFYEKSVRDRKAGTMKAAVVAKLAYQTATNYNAVKEACNSSVLNPVLDASWSYHADYQAKSFFAAAEFWQAHAVKEAAVARGSGYGEEITRLGLAEKWMRQGLEAAQRNKLGGALIAAGETLLTTICSLRQKAITENNTIYMDAIPPDSSVTSVVGVSMVRPSSLPEYYNAEKPFFKDILPKELRLLRGQFRDDITSLLRTATESSEQALTGGRAALNAIGLPASLEAYRSAGKIPDNMIQKFSRVNEMGGRAELDSKWEELEAASKRALNTIAAIEETLAREEKIDYNFRAKYPTWTGTGSVVLTTDIRSTNSRMRDAFGAARESDGGIQRELQDAAFASWIKLICGPIAALTAMLPTPPPDLLDFTDMAGSDRATTSTAITLSQHLDKLLTEMTQLIDKREQIIAQMKEINTKDITEELLANVATSPNPGSVCEEYKKICSDHNAAIAKTIERQQALLVEITSTNDAFQKALSTDSVVVERERLLREFEQTATRYFNVHAMITAGITFYSNLQVRLSTLQQNSDDLGYSQQLLRQEYEIQYRREMDMATQREASQFAQLSLSMATPPVAAQPMQQQPQQVNPQAMGQSNYGAPQGNSSYISGFQDAGNRPQQQSNYPTPGQQQGNYPTPGQQQSNYPTPGQQQSNYPTPGQQQYPSTGIPSQSYSAPSQQQQYGQPQLLQQNSSQHAPYGAPSMASMSVPSQPMTQQYSQQLLPPQQQQPSSMQPSGMYSQYQPQQQQQQQQQHQQPEYTTGQPIGAGYLPQPQLQQTYAPPSLSGQYAYPGNPQPAPQQPHQMMYGQPQMQGQMYQGQPAAPGGGVPTGADLQAKAQRLSEMGFPIAACMNALASSGGDENTALNLLLQGDGTNPASPAAPGPGSASASSTAAAASAPAAAPPTKPVKPSGLFGKVWGKN